MYIRPRIAALKRHSSNGTSAGPSAEQWDFMYSKGGETATSNILLTVTECFSS